LTVQLCLEKLKNHQHDGPHAIGRTPDLGECAARSKVLDVMGSRSRQGGTSQVLARQHLDPRGDRLSLLQPLMGQ
jgi:hypothetical protein